MTGTDSAMSLRSRRLAVGLTQVQLAERAGCSTSLIRMFDRGYVPAQSQVLTRVLAVLDEAPAVAERPMSLPYGALQKRTRRYRRVLEDIVARAPGPPRTFARVMAQRALDADDLDLPRENSLAGLELPVRTWNCLVRAGFGVDGLRSASDAELLAIEGLGETGLTAVRAALRQPQTDGHS